MIEIKLRIEEIKPGLLAVIRDPSEDTNPTPLEQRAAATLASACDMAAIEVGKQGVWSQCYELPQSISDASGIIKGYRNGTITPPSSSSDN